MQLWSKFTCCACMVANFALASVPLVSRGFHRIYPLRSSPIKIYGLAIGHIFPERSLGSMRTQAMDPKTTSWDTCALAPHAISYGDLLSGFAEQGSKLMILAASTMAKFQSSTGSFAISSRDLAFSRMNRMDISTKPFWGLAFGVLVSCVMPFLLK